MEPVYLEEAQVLKYLSWDTLIPAIEDVLQDVTQKDSQDMVHPPKTRIPSEQGVMGVMPSYSSKLNLLGCKVVTTFPGNEKKGLPSIHGNVLLLDPQIGKTKAILEAAEITAWRTAAASVVATKHLHKGKKNILAILGAGVQGRIHALALQHYFHFSEVRVWNRTYEKAVNLCSELGPWAKPYKNNELCVRGADVITTTTMSPTTIVSEDWLQPGTHINAVGYNKTPLKELSAEIYRRSTLVVDSEESGAGKDIRQAGGLERGINVYCELGKVISGSISIPLKDFTVFQSVGMSIEDLVTADLVYKSYLKDKTKSL